MNSHRLTIIHMALALYAFGISDCVPQMVPANSPRQLTGSAFKLEDAVSRADAIFIGTVLDGGVGSYKSAGEIIYHHIKVGTSLILRGTIRNPIYISARVRYSKDMNEEDLAQGASYIFFVKNNAEQKLDSVTALKIISPTDANIAKVNALIAILPPN